MLQIVRRAVQITCLLVVIAMPVVSNYAALLSGRGQQDFARVAIDDSGKVLGSLYTLIHRVVDPPFNPAETVPSIDPFKGAIFSINLWGFNITDPLAAIVVMFTSGGIVGPLIVALLIPLAFTLLLGRAFCGWICPMGLILETVDYIKERTERWFGFLFPDIHISSSYRYYILAGGLVAALLGAPLLIFLLPYGLVSREAYNYIFYMGFSFGAGLILLMIAFDLVSKRGWCRYLCPAGAFFSSLSYLRVLRVKRTPSGCPDDCRVCTENCTMGLEPHRDSFGLACDNCGSCVSSCPANTIKFKLGR